MLTPPVAAQGAAHERWESSSWVDDFNFASANAVLGGLTAGVVSALRGGSFSEAFVGGALGGGVSYVGKRLAAARFDGAGLMGRQVGAVGASMVNNASQGTGLLDSLMLPLGPVRLVVSPSNWRSGRLQIDLQESYWLVYASFHDDLDIDWGRSVSAGAPVFLTSARLDDAAGFVVGGLIVLTRDPVHGVEQVFSHERVHVIQSDVLRITMGYPLERWIREEAGLSNRLWDHVLLGIGHEPFRYSLFRVWARSARFTEIEADFLEVR